MCVQPPPLKRDHDPGKAVHHHHHHSATSSKERSREGEEPPGSAAIWKKVMMCQIREDGGGNRGKVKGQYGGEASERESLKGVVVAGG